MFSRAHSCQPDAVERSRLTVSGFARQCLEIPYDLILTIHLFYGNNYKIYVRTSTLCSLEEQTKEIEETFRLHREYPHIFTEYGCQYVPRTPTRAFLLYGPRGCGQELITKSIACRGDYNYFTLDISRLLSQSSEHWTAQIRGLFDLCRESAPSVLALLNVDELSEKAAENLDSDSSKSTDLGHVLSSEIDALPPMYEEHLCLITISHGPFVRSTNPLRTAYACPWTFDNPIFIDLPCLEDRLKILSVAFDGYPWLQFVDNDMSDLAAKTHGFNRTDLSNLAIHVIAAVDATEADKQTVQNAIDGTLEAYERSVSVVQYQAVLDVKNELDRPLNDTSACSPPPILLTNFDDDDDIYE